MSDFKSKSEDSIKGDGAPHPDIYVQTANNDMFEDGTVNPVYQAKARLLNAAIQEIGMGRYQVRGRLLEVKIAAECLSYSGICLLLLVSAGSRMFSPSLGHTARTETSISIATVYGR